MDTLPIELLRLIFEYADVTTARTMRLVAPALAEVGYDYMLASQFTVLRRTNDADRLQNIASHPRLSGGIQALTLNFSELDEYIAQQASYFQNHLKEPEERQMLLQEAWTEFYERERAQKPSVGSDEQSTMIASSVRKLTNLKTVNVTYSTCPYDIAVVKKVFDNVFNCRRIDRERASKDLTGLISAMAQARITNLTIDRIPFEIFSKSSVHRQQLLAHGPDAFRSLEHLDITLDAIRWQGPSSERKAMLGLGRMLQFAANLTHLSLAFQSYSSPRNKALVVFEDIFENFTFKRLTDLRLEGITCAEQDLRQFLIRHGDTLERLRLGGRGLAKPYEQSIGGLHLYSGTFKALFVGLRGRLPKLQRFHLEGDFETPRAFGHVGEVYRYGALTDNDWTPIAQARHISKTTISSLAIEEYLVRGGAYPGPAQITLASQ